MIELGSLLGFVLIFALALASCGGGGSAPNPKPSVEINGDSIAAGIGLPVNVAAYLATIRPGWVVVDRAVPGLLLYYLHEGYERPYDGSPVPPWGPQPPFAEVKRTADVIVVQPGANDARGVSPEVFEAKLRDIVRTIQSEGRVAVLTGLTPITPGEIFRQADVDNALVLNAITRQVAVDTGALHAGWDTLEPQTRPDGLHPDQETLYRLTERLAQTIDTIHQPASAGFLLPVP